MLIIIEIGSFENKRTQIVPYNLNWLAGNSISPRVIAVASYNVNPGNPLNTKKLIRS